jgi:predicted Zn-dependent peptidase
MVFASVGNISFARLIYHFEKFFGNIPVNTRTIERAQFSSYQPFTLSLKKNTFQVHAIIGNLGYDMKDPRRIGLHLLSNIIGGPGMISRLNLALRERKGYSYNIESSYTPCSDTGIFTIYFSSDKENLYKCFDIIHKEFDTLRNKPLGTLQLKKAKQQIMGQLAISFESNENQMLSIGKSCLVYDRVDPLDEIFAKLEMVKATELMDIANEVLNREQLSTLIFR